MPCCIFYMDSGYLVRTDLSGRPGTFLSESQKGDIDAVLIILFEYHKGCQSVQEQHTLSTEPSG